MRSSRPALLAVLSLLLLAPAGRAADTGPALSVAPEALAASLTCPTSLAGATRAPVLLVPGTNYRPSAFDFNYQPALTAAGIPWCTVELPRYALGDLQVAAEHVVFALRRMREQAGRRVSVIGWSQGGMLPRWALKHWPDTRLLVEDLVGLAPSNHGTRAARAVCATRCPPAYAQQRDDAQFIRALNTGPETFAGVDYTSLFTRLDQVVVPNADAATGSSALRTGDGRRANVALQELCPTNGAEHFQIGTTDAVAYALALDALTHDGPADPARVPRTVCAETAMPGVDPLAYPADQARLLAELGPGFAQAEYVTREPALRCYADPACPRSAGATARAACTSRRRFTVRLDRALRRARVTVAGRAVRVTRRAGRLTAVVDLRGRPRGTVRVVVRGTTKAGRSIVRVRAFRACSPRA